MVIWRTFFKAKARHLCQQWAATHDPQVHIFKKCAKVPLSVADCHALLDEQHRPLRTYQGVFFQERKNPLRIQIAVYFL
jgi:hypothetical protein